MHENVNVDLQLYHSICKTHVVICLYLENTEVYDIINTNNI